MDGLFDECVNKCDEILLLFLRIKRHVELHQNDQIPNRSRENRNEY